MERAFSVVLLMLLLPSMLASGLNAQPAVAGGTIFIRADGSIDPPTAPIWTVDNTDYTFTDNAYDSVVVERDNIVIDGDGHTLQGSGSGDGISLAGRRGVTIKSIQIEKFARGIFLDSSYKNNISGNNIANNGYGIVLNQYSRHNLIRGNNIEANSNAGIVLDSSSDNFIYYNNFRDNAEQADSYASTNVWNDDYPFGGNYWSDYAGVDEKGGPEQDLPGGDGVGDIPYVIYGDTRDEYPLMEPAPVTALVYGVHRILPLNVVFVGFAEEVVDTDTIDANIEKDYQFRYEYYDVGYAFDVSYHFADSSYYDALRTFVLANSVTNTTSALDVTALQIQKTTGTKMSIFTPESGTAVNATAVEEWFVTNPFRADLEPTYWFYVINFSGLDSTDLGAKHWYTVKELDFEAGRLRDFWRLEWDNTLNPDVGFPYACFTSQSRVLFIDPSAFQWYLSWAKTWWGLPVSGPKYEYYEADLGEFLSAHNTSTGPGRTALAYYLAGWIEDGLVNLLAPHLYPGVDVFRAESLSIQTLILNNAADFGYDNEAMRWIADSALCEGAIVDLAPWMDVEVVFKFENLGDHPQLATIFDDAVLEEKDGWTYYDGMQLWRQLTSVRESYFDFTAADLVINGYVYLEKNMSMRVYGGEYTGLGGGKQILVMQEVGRYFEEDGVTPRSGLGRTLIHEAGHNFGFPHTFTSAAYAGDFAFDVMGYYPHAYFFTQFRKDSFRRLVVDFRLVALQEKLDKVAAVYGRRTPKAAIEAEFDVVSSEVGQVLQLYEALRFLEAYSKIVEAEESLTNLEYLILEYVVDTPPEIPEVDPVPRPETTSRRCFIATAAYGTPMAGEIEILRDFRDAYLLTNSLGQAFVDFYYGMSPPIAEFINEHPTLKPIMRAGLMPAVVVSTVAVNTTPPEKTAVIGLLMVLSVAVAIWSTRERGRRRACD